MKLFDVVGAVVVTTWVVLAGLYVYETESSEPRQVKGLSDDFVMQEGQTWLILRREGDEVGFVHQTRTEITDGWLLEYDMLMTIELLGSERAIDTTVKSRLDHDGYLTEFTAEVNASGRNFKARGEVDGTRLETELYLSDEPKKKTIELQEKPRLSSSAFNQLLASGNLEPGEEFAERFFDPTTMQMTEMVMLYKGETEVDVYDRKLPGHYIIQKVAGNELDVYVDDQGEILVQEFPLRMIGVRVPNELGRARAAAIRKQIKERKDKQKGSGGGEFDFDLGTAMDLLGGKAAPSNLGPDQPEQEQPKDQPAQDSKSPDAGTDAGTE